MLPPALEAADAAPLPQEPEVLPCGEEDDMMADVAALAGGHAGGAALATLDSALRPIERYAVRLLEEVRAGAHLYRLMVRATGPAVLLCVSTLTVKGIQFHPCCED